MGRGQVVERLTANMTISCPDLDPDFSLQDVLSPPN